MTPLQHQLASMSFAGGVDEKTQPELVDVSQSLLVVENMTHEKLGALSKSKGAAALSDTGFNNGIATGRALLTNGDQLVMLDGQYLNTYSDAATGNSRVGACSEVVCTRDAIEGSSAYIGTCVLCNGFIFVATYDSASASVRTVVLDATTRKVVKTFATAISIGSESFRLLAIGSVAILVYVSASNIFARTVSAANTTSIALEWSAQTTLAIDFAAGAAGADWSADVNSSYLYIGYARSASGRVRYYDTSLTQVGSAVHATSGSAQPNCFDIQCNGNSVLIAYGITTAVWVAEYDSALTLTVTAASIMTLTNNAQRCAIANTGTATDLVAAQGSITADGELKWRTLETGSGTAVGTGSTNTICSWWCPVKLTAKNSGGVLGVYGWVTWQTPAGAPTSLQYTAALCDFLASTTTLRAVATPAPRLNGCYRGYGGQAWIDTDERRLLSVHPVIASTSVYSIELVECDFYGHAHAQSASLRSSSFLSGGVPSVYDGGRVCEAGFVVRPVLDTPGSTGTGLTGTFAYVAVYKHVDDAGNLIHSGTSDPVSITVANKTITVDVSTLGVTQRHSATAARATIITLARTENGGTTYYEVASTANTPGVVAVTFSDSTSDTVLRSGRLLYRQPGLLGTTQPKACPPSLYDLAVHGDRVVGLADDGSSVWYSAPFVYGELPWFADAFQFSVEGQGGRNVAIWTQDGRIVVAKSSALYVVDGDGPPENGGNGSEFSPPRRLPSDVGCTERRSVVATTLGTFFRSRRGIELLDRSLQVQWIGEGVQDTLALFPVVTSAVFDPIECRVLFTCAATETLSGVGTSADTGVTLVLDIQAGTWTVEKRRGASAGQPAQSAAIVEVSGVPRYVWLSSAGPMYRETADANASEFLDGSTWKTAAMETGWIKHSMLEDARTWALQLLFKRHTNHDLTIKIAYNFVNSWVDTKSYTAAELAALTRDVVELRPSRPRTSAIKVRIEDATPTTPADYPVTTGRGSTFIGLALDFTQRPGATKGTPRLGEGARR